MSAQAESALEKEVKLAAPRSLYFAIFAISGFSGLIYESIWSHYLKLFLGHAAYAQSLVLIIFMGGMAAGSWIASRFSQRIKIPILVYAIVEAIVGVVALVFHGVFTGVVDVFYASVLPAIGVPVVGATLKWLAASILIMPQSILLGMTFPLMSAGIIRRFPDTQGGSIAMLYFTNSIGASIGVLASGFWLIKAVGLPGTILTAGLLNILLALVVWILVRLDPKPETEPLPQTDGTQTRHTLRTLFLIAAFITGAASFIYEISWIRMLSLVLGATTHSFELMLSAFIAGLAFGGLWIKRRIDRIADPVKFSGFVQLIMGLFALSTIPVYMMSYDWMTWLMSALGKTDQGFTGFSIASHVIALAVMLPTTFMAGMTLPLFTYVLIRKGDGEASIGRIYAANTIGAIIGVLFAVHIGLPLIGLKNLVVFGAALDIALAIVLLRYAVRGRQQRSFGLTAGSLIGVAAIAVMLVAVDIDKRLLVSGVYRFGSTTSAADDEILFYRDGKTASVSLRRHPDGGRVVLSTNGKPDASIQMDPTKEHTLDEVTMTIAGTIPFAYKPDAEHIANIGMGSGQTTHVLLGNPRVKFVDTIEIEAQMVEASKGFGEAVARAYEDPRSRIFIEDAKTYFSLHNSVYDIIIAEPSNPWVSGVASLFSTEFYATVKKHLAEDGLFVQWIQLYEFNDALAESIMKALAENFGDFAIYATDSADILLIAKNEGELDDPHWDILWEDGLKESLNHVGVNSLADVMIRKVAEREALIPYLDLVPSPVNSDYFPYVDLNAGRARYTQSRAEAFTAWMQAPLPMLEMLYDDSIEYAEVTSSQYLLKNDSINIADWVHRKIIGETLTDPEAWDEASIDRLRYISDWLLLSEVGCAANTNPERWHDTVFDMALIALPYLEPARALELVDRLHATGCAPAQSDEATSWAELYRAVAIRDSNGMSVSGRRLLGRGSELSDSRHAYLVAATMLGDIAAGRPAEAHDVWLGHGEALFADFELPHHMKLLLSIAVDGATKAEMAAAY